MQKKRKGMALIKCSECSNEVSDKAESCPKCGAPINTDEKNIPAIKPNEKSKAGNINASVFLLSVMFPLITPLIYQFTKASKKQKLQSWLASIIFIAIIIIGGRGQNTNTYQSTPTENSIETTASYANTNRCLKVPNEMTSTIQSGFKANNIKLLPKTVYAVKSTDFKNIYFIAGKLSNGEIAVWSSNSLKTGEGIIMTADSYSSEISIWPDGRKSKSKLSMSDDGFSNSLHCSQNLTK